MRSVIAASLLVCACSASAQPLLLSSPDMRDRAPLARSFYYSRCGGANLAPALAWSGGPADTQSYALTLIDISVEPAHWSHWIVTGIPAANRSLPRGGALPRGARSVQSNFGDLTYDGPCPPSGVHHYQFTLYAFRGAAPEIPADANAVQLAQSLSSAAAARATLEVTATPPS
jgi:Raf kinase inhibitor-like YbhB/YbcL family protein